MFLGTIQRSKNFTLRIIVFILFIMTASFWITRTFTKGALIEERVSHKTKDRHDSY